MRYNKINRRKLLQSAAAGAAWGYCGFAGTPAMAAESAPAVKIRDPFHGAVLNHRHGKQTAEGLTIRVCGEARPGDRVTINGAPCRVEGKRFDADVVLRTPETDLVAVAEGAAGRHEDRVRVVWDRYSVPRYRFSIDDDELFPARHRAEELCLAVRLLLPEDAPRPEQEVRREVHAEHLLHGRRRREVSHRRRLQAAPVPRPLQERVARQRALAAAGLPRVRQHAELAVSGCPAGEAHRGFGPGGGRDSSFRRRGGLRAAHGDPFCDDPSFGVQAALRRRSARTDGRLSPS